MNKLRIKKFGVLSVAKIQGLIGLVIGLIIGVIYGLFIIAYSVFGGAMLGGDAGRALGGSGVLVGIGLMIAMPILYGVIGFIGGAIGAVIYNIFARIVGGLEIEVENIY